MYIFAGQDRHIIWIMNLQDGFPRHNHCNHPAFPRQACIGAGYASCNSTSTGRQEQEDGHDFWYEVAFMNFQSMLALNIYGISSAPSRIV